MDSQQGANQTGERVRLNIAIPPFVKDQLDSIVDRSGASSVTEVIRRSVALYDLVLEHISEDGTLVFRNSDGTEEVLKILA